MNVRYLLVTATIFIAVLSSSTLYSQPKDTAFFPYWIEMMQDPSVNFYSTQRAFEKYWDNRSVQKGDGFKAFKRWEWFMELEVNPDGTYPDRDHMEREYRSFERNFGTPQATSGFATQSVSGTWNELGPVSLPANGTGQPNGLGRLNAVALHPTDTGIILVGASNGGLWRTSNHGQSWTSNSDTLISMQVSSIQFNPLNPSIVYAGTGDRDAGSRSQAGVLKSTDGGVSWQRKNSGMGNRIVGMLAIIPDQPDTILAATSGGIYRSLNGANSWSLVSSNTAHYKDIVFMPNNPQIAYATEGGRFYRSADYGASWTQITSGIPSGTRGVIGVTEDDSLYVYFVLCQGSAFRGMYRSTDGGLNFSTRSTTPNIMDWSTNGSGTGGQAWYNLDVAVDPNNKNTIFVGGINIFKSSDGGATWLINADWVGRAGADAIHADQHALEYSADKKRLYSGCDGGLYFSQNGNNWTDISSGLAISEVYKIGQARYNPNNVICGYQDNGTAIYYGNNTWRTEIGGDGMECIVDPDDNRFMYGALYYGAIRRSTNNGSSFGTIAQSGSNGITESGAWVTPYLLHEGNPNTMFIGYRNLWRSTNVRNGNSNTLNWQRISNNLAGTNNQTIRVLEQSTANYDIMYMARADRKLFLSTNVNDSMPSWVDLSANLPQNAIIADIECHPFLDSVVYILQNRDIYKSSDLGTSWTNISGNLPNVTLRCLVYDEYSNEGIYVGGTPGVYYKDSTMNNWIVFSTGLPTDVSVTELEIQYDTLVPARSLLRASTYGRGLWSSDLYDDGTNKPIAGINLSEQATCVGNTVQLESRSAYLPNSFTWLISPSTYTIQSGSMNTPQLSIRLDSAAYYSVQLIAGNANGNDTLTMLNALRAIDTSTAPTCFTSTQNMTSQFGIGIYEFRMGDFVNYSSGFDGQNSAVDFTCQGIIELEADSAYALYVGTGGANDEYADVYIDYNGDGDFLDSMEQISSMPRARRAHSDTIRTPVNPLFNNYLRLRVVSDFWDISNDPCKSLGYGESEDYLVYFNFSDAELMASADTICRPDTVVFTADSLIGRIDSLVWDFGSMASPAKATGAGPHYVVFNQAATHNVSLKINDLSPKTKNIIVADWPSIQLSVSDTAICERDSLNLQLQDTLSNTNTVQYRWTRNGFPLNALGDTMIARSQAQWFDAGRYRVIARNFACIDTSNEVQVRVSPNPSSEIGLLSDSVQCFNENEFSFLRKSSISVGNVSGTWHFSAGNHASVDTLQVNFAQSGRFAIELRDTSDYGCIDSAQITVEVLQSPEANFMLDSAQCFNQHQLELIDQSQYFPSQQRLWTLGDGTQNSDSVYTKKYTNPGIYAVQLHVQLPNGCKDSLQRQAHISPNPEAQLSLNDTVFCFKNNALRASDLSTGSGNMTRTWSFGDGNSSTDSLAVHSYLGFGFYSLQLISENADACTDTAYANIEVLPNPNANFSFSTPRNAHYIFTPSDTNHRSYLWDFGDGNTDTLMIAAHTYMQNGNFQVSLQISDTNNCVDTGTQEIQLESVGTVENDAMSFVLYPNPSNGRVFLSRKPGAEKHVQIFDAEGSLVKELMLNEEQYLIELGSFSAGMYLVSLGTEKSRLIIY